MNKSTTKLAPRTMEEQETTIVFDRAGDTMRIYTADTTMITYLDKRYPRAKEYTDKGGLYAVEYVVDKDLLSFRTKKVKRILTPEQKEARRQTLARNRKKKTTAVQDS